MHRTNPLIRALDRLTTALRLRLSTARRVIVLALTYGMYVLATALTVDSMAVSTNYYVLVPMFMSAALFGWYGGIVAGVLALPSNLLLYYLLAALQVAPAHPLVAWVSGIMTGVVLGYFSDFFRRLQLADQENRFLVQELHHRVKNNLGIISGLIQYHSMAVSDPEAQQNLQQLKQRVHSIAAVHDRLYLSDTRTISAAAYLRELVHHIADSLVGDSQDISFSFALRPLQFGPDELMSIGLITNEFVTNSLEHAFPAGRGEITLRLHENGDGALLELSDDGRGLPDGFSVEESRTLGFSLMQSLATRVHARIEIDGSRGTTVRVHLKRRGRQDKPD